MPKIISIFLLVHLSVYAQSPGQANSNQAPQLIVASNPQRTSVKDINNLTTKQFAKKTTFVYDSNCVGILLPVVYKGKELLFVLDTGTSITAFDSSFAKELGKPKRMQGAISSGGKTEIPVYNAPEAYLGPYNLKDYGEVICINMRMLSYAAGDKISGIIGMNFLKNHCIQIDADNSKVTIYNEPLIESDNLGQSFNLKFDMGLPFLYNSISGSSQSPFLIDLGAYFDVKLQTKKFDKLIKSKKLPTTEILYETASGIVKGRQARLDRFNLGNYEYKDLLMGDGDINILGFQFLDRHIVTMDFPKKKIYFKKGKNFSSVHQANMSGLNPIKIEDKITVYSVDKDSPAETAGIKPQDVIMKIEGKDASQLHLTQLGSILRSGDARKISLTIQRGDQTLDVSVVLKKEI